MKITRTMQFSVRVTIVADSDAQWWQRCSMVKHWLTWFLSTGHTEDRQSVKAFVGSAMADVTTQAIVSEVISHE